MSEDLFSLVGLIVAVLSITAGAILVGYWLGHRAGYRIGWAAGAAFGRRKLNEEKYNDGYGSYS